MFYVKSIMSGKVYMLEGIPYGWGWEVITEAEYTSTPLELRGKVEKGPYRV